MRTGIYTRISQEQASEEDDDYGAGVERQREACQTLADELGWQVVEVYLDSDSSATTGKVREHYERMIADIKAGRVEAVIAWHTDRLYRRVADLEEFAKVCEAYNVAVRTCRSGELDMSTPTGRMIARILGTIATYEVEQKADRWISSVRQRRKAGRWWNSANRMFGYTRDGEIVPGEADALRHVVNLILSGGTITGACRWLNEQGWRTSRDNEWMPSSLRNTLRSPKVAGLSALDGVILGPGSWEPIIDRETWERVNAAFATGRRLRTPPRRALLSGIAFCGVEDCGRRLYRALGRGNRPTYRCETELKANGHVAISATALEGFVESYARERLADDTVRRALAARLAGSGTHAARITKEIDDIETEIHELSEALRDAGKRSKLELASAIDDLDGQLTAKRRELSAIPPVQIPPPDEWPDDLDRRAALIGLVVERAVVLPATVKGGRFDPGRVRIEPVADVGPSPAG